MIQGKVLASRGATIRVKVRGTSDSIAQVDAIIDTGFNDQLTLPPWVIEKLGLKFIEATDFTLGDGAKSNSRVLEGMVEWHGTWRTVRVVEIDNDALVGMELLDGSNLSIDVVDGGNVKIQPLPPAFGPQPSLS